MYKIAICDDDSLQVSHLETQISKYFDGIEMFLLLGEIF